MVANHLAELAGQRAYATLTGRLSAIAQAHALLRLPFDKRDPALRKILQGVTGRLVRALFGYHLCYPSRRQPTPAFTLPVEVLRNRG
jgi:hypothetical protein